MRKQPTILALSLVCWVGFSMGTVVLAGKPAKAPAKATKRTKPAPVKRAPDKLPAKKTTKKDTKAKKAAKKPAPAKRAPAKKKVSYAVLVTPKKKLMVNKPATVTVTADKQPLNGARIAATYYPSSKVAFTVIEKLRTDTGGTLQWKPTHPGLVIVKLVKEDGKDKEGKPKYKTLASSTVGVRYSGIPLGGLVVFLVAGFLLFGGMTFGFYKAFSKE